MADRKISDLTALTTPASGDFLPIVDISEAAAASKNKKITYSDFLNNIPTGTITSTMILDGTILNADINASAAIVDTKLDTIATAGKVSGTAITSGNISTSGSFTSTSTVTGTNLIPTGSGVPTNGIYLPAANSVAVSTGGAPRITIDSGGRLLVGTSTVLTSGFVSIQFDGSAYNGITLKTTYASNGSNYLAFTGSGGALAGYIQQTGSTTVSYTTTSDYRLKENVALIGDSITRLQQLKPSRFNFISEPDRIVDGFLAHEAQAVVPECVTGEKDEVDDDGTPVYQGIDQSKLVPLLTAALQEAIGEIESLKARLTAAGI
jgi:hypothetical protein